MFACSSDSNPETQPVGSPSRSYQDAEIARAEVPSDNFSLEYDVEMRDVSRSEDMVTTDLSNDEKYRDQDENEHVGAWTDDCEEIIDRSNHDKDLEVAISPNDQNVPVPDIASIVINSENQASSNLYYIMIGWMVSLYVWLRRPRMPYSAT